MGLTGVSGAVGPVGGFVWAEVDDGGQRQCGKDGRGEPKVRE